MNESRDGPAPAVVRDARGSHRVTTASGSAPADALARAASADVLTRLAADFSPRYERVDEDMVLIDVSGLGRVIGPPVEVARELVRAAAVQGVRLALAIASTRTAATLLALHGATRIAALPATAARSASERVPAACAIEIRTIGGSAVTSGERAHVAGAAVQASASEQTSVSEQTGVSEQTTASEQTIVPVQAIVPMQATASTQTTASMQTMGRGTGRDAPRLSRRRVAAPAPPVGIVVLPGEEARALAGLPIALLARLPGDAHGVMTGLPGVPQGDRARGGGADDGERGAAAGKGGAGRGRGGARFSEQANGAYGKTRGKRSRGSGRNYRLAPSPGETRAETIALLDTLQRWGLHTLGELLRLPAAELFERFGPASFWLRQVASGLDARPLVPTVAEEAFDAELALEWPIENLEPLAFVISRLLDPLCARLEQRDRGAVVVHVALRLVTRGCETRRLELPAPMRDAKVLRTLILLDLESHPPGAGIDVVTLRFEVTPGRIVQHSLLTRALPSPEQLSTLIARLTAVMGEGRVGAPALIDSHRPEAFALRRFNPPAVASAFAGPLAGMLGGALAPAAGRGGAAAGSSRGGAEGAARAAGEARAQHDGSAIPAMPAGSSLRRFRRPLPVDVRVEGDRPVHLAATRGVRGGRIVQAAGPWRSSGQWWQLGAPGAPVPPTAPASPIATSSPTALASPTKSPPVSPPASASPIATGSPTALASATMRDSPTASASATAPASATARDSPTAPASATTRDSPTASASATAPASATARASPTAPASATMRDSPTASTSATAPVSTTKSALPPTPVSPTRSQSRVTGSGAAVSGTAGPGATMSGAGAAVPGIAAAGVSADGGAASVPGAFTRAWVRDEWDIVLAGGELCRIYYDVARCRWLLESIID